MDGSDWAWLVIVAAGFLILAAVTRLAHRRSVQLQQARRDLAALNVSLDRLVAERTGELELARTAAMSLARDAQQAQRQAAQAQADLATANHELTLRNEEMEQFVFTVSHDLKAPLITMLGFLTMMQDDLAHGRTSDLADSARRVEAGARRMERLIADLLQLSRIGRLKDEPQDIDTPALVREVCESLAIPIRQARAQVHIQPDMPALHMDRTRLAQVFENLISNAVKYGCEGSARRIEVGGRIEGAHVSFFVRDHGPGIAPQYHQTIFALFQRLHNDARGTGVGLTIVERVIQVHGGRIWVESEPGRGATFRFQLPAALPAREDRTDGRPAARGQSRAVPSLLSGPSQE